MHVSARVVLLLDIMIHRFEGPTQEKDIGYSPVMPDSIAASWSYEDVIELVRAARAWDEEEPPYDGPKHDRINQRLQAAYRRFTRPYADDEFAEGIIISAQTPGAHPAKPPRRTRNISASGLTALTIGQIRQAVTRAAQTAYELPEPSRRDYWREAANLRVVRAQYKRIAADITSCLGSIIRQFEDTRPVIDIEAGDELDSLDFALRVHGDLAPELDQMSSFTEKVHAAQKALAAAEHTWEILVACPARELARKSADGYYHLGDVSLREDGIVEVEMELYCGDDAWTPAEPFTIPLDQLNPQSPGQENLSI